MNENVIKLAQKIEREGLHKKNKIAAEFLKEFKALQAIQKKAYFRAYTGQGFKQAEGLFFYTAWAFYFKMGDVVAEPPSNLSPANTPAVKKAFREASREMFVQAHGLWSNSPAKTEFSKLMTIATSAFAKLGEEGEDRSADAFTTLFLKAHGDQSSRHIWTLIQNSPATDFVGAIKSVGGYVVQYMTRKTLREGDKRELNEATTGEIVGHYLADTNSLTPDQEAEMRELMFSAGNLDTFKVQVAEMLDQNWSRIVALYWDDTILDQIMEISRKVSSSMLAPMVIKSFKFLSLDQLDNFTTFIDDCMDADSLEASYVKQVKNLNRSLPQWVNLYLAVGGDYSAQGVTFSGSLHGGGNAWASSIMSVVDSGVNSKTYFAGLYSACEDYLPSTTMALSQASFVKTMEGFADTYRDYLTKDRAKAKAKFKDYFKAGYFKGASGKYPQSLIAAPMAEAVRMRLTLQVTPEEFQSDLEGKDFEVCKKLIENLFEIPSSVLEVVKDGASDGIVDDIIMRLEDEVEKTPIKINDQAGGGA
jgi:hypothetical protein